LARFERERGIRILHDTFALVSIRAGNRPLQEKMRARSISANSFAPHRKSPLVHGHGYRVGCIVVLEHAKSTIQHARPSRPRPNFDRLAAATTPAQASRTNPGLAGYS
jgi:hypothetical protein